MLRLLTFGGLSVHGAKGPLSGSAAQPRRLAVLVMVARGARSGTTRGKLVGVLWPDADEEQGRRVVTQALYALRRDLGRDDAILGTQELRLNEDVLGCDACEFDAALSRGDAARAAALYAGPFLDGFRLPGAPEFERWADDERAALRHRLRDAVESLARDAEQRGAHAEAAGWWRRRAADDPLNARVALSLMRALAAAGDRVGALRHAGIFEALMAEELELPPDREVIEYAETLRRDAHAAAAPQSPPPSTATVAKRATASAPVAAATRSIAVLPLALLGPNHTPHDDRSWCDGLAEEIISALLATPGFRVVARNASFALGPNPGLTLLRGELGVPFAIEGSMSRTASGLRATLRLIETDEGHALAWEKFHCEAEDPHALQERIAQTFAEKVREAVG